MAGFGYTGGENNNVLLDTWISERGLICLRDLHYRRWGSTYPQQHVSEYNTLVLDAHCRLLELCGYTGLVHLEKTWSQIYKRHGRGFSEWYEQANSVVNL